MSDNDDNRRVQEEAAARQLAVEAEMELQRQVQLLEKLEQSEGELEESIAIMKRIAEDVEVKEQNFIRAFSPK